MGRIWHDVLLCEVILLLATRLSSSASLGIGNASNRHLISLPAENPAWFTTCTEEREQECARKGEVCDDMEGEVKCIAKPPAWPTTCTEEKKQECARKGEVCDDMEGEVKCIAKPPAWLTTCTEERKQECARKGEVCDDTEGEVKCIARSKPQPCRHRGQSVCRQYGKICVSYDGGEVCADPAPLTAAPENKRNKDGCVCNCKCQPCAVDENGSSQVAVRNSSQKERGLAAETAAIYEKLGALMPLTERVDSLLQLKGMVTALQVSLQHISDKHDKVLNRLSSIDNEVTSMKLRISRVEMSGINRKISELQKQLANYNEYLNKQTFIGH